MTNRIQASPRTGILSGILILTAITMGTLTSCAGEAGKPENSAEGYTPGLALQMHYMQVWTHKLALSIEAGNLELADFYHHELEESTEDLIGTVPEYGGIAVANLTRAMLVPALESLEEALEYLEGLHENAESGAGSGLDSQAFDAGWSDIRRKFEAVVNSCNACHAATGYGYIRVTAGYGNNPFNQDFGN